ncbi:hypothetical protein NDA18_006028 [Ustilago nuda]|nr:hypothetical protein NDA18_006028 [Ustilago nuda]
MSWYQPSSAPTVGYWGPITSTLLWCESKYAFSPYIAEPVNTFTNLFFVSLSLYGFHTTRSQCLALRYSICHLGVALVGVGSALFHGTLKHEMQLLDELPMIYTSAIMTYCLTETSKGYANPRFPLLLPAALVALTGWITAVYLWNGNPLFHQVAYAAMQVLSTARVIYLLRSSKSQLNTTTLAKERKEEITNLYIFGTLIFLLGFAVWNIDNIFCYNLHQARNKLGYPCALLLEGHGWWHILTGWGAYCTITAGIQLAVGEKEHPRNFKQVGRWLPRLVRLRPYTTPSKVGPGRNKAN